MSTTQALAKAVVAGRFDADALKRMAAEFGTRDVQAKLAEAMNS